MEGKGGEGGGIRRRGKGIEGSSGLGEGEEEESELITALCTEQWILGDDEIFLYMYPSLGHCKDYIEYDYVNHAFQSYRC